MSRATAAGSVREALSAAVDSLAAAGVDSSRLDAELMLSEATGRDRAALAAAPESPVSPGEGRAFGEMVRRRARREPLAYILGRKGFRRIELAVDRRVLIPRPETEMLVEIALELGERTVADIGTGSGAVALAIADELPDAEIVACDTSERALDVARANASRLGLADRIRFEHGAIPEGQGFGVIFANLPYVTEGEWDWLAPEITEYEPREAVVSGPTGLEAARGLTEAIRTGRVFSAALAVEAGAGRAEETADLVRQAGFDAIDVRQDLAGIERVVLGRR